MATDMVLIMRGLAKLSQAIVETQSNTLRNGTGKYTQTVCFPSVNIWIRVLFELQLSIRKRKNKSL